MQPNRFSERETRAQTCPFPLMYFARTETQLVPLLPSALSGCRTHLQLRDRGLVALDWAGSTPSAPPANPDESLVIVLVLPELGRGPCSVGDTCRAIIGRGMRPVVLSQRGHAGCPLTTPRLQASALSSGRSSRGS